MRFSTAISTIALALSGSAIAQSTEEVTITSLTLHKAGVSGTSVGTVDGAAFKLDGNDGKGIDCSATAAGITSGVPTADLACGSSTYKFSVLPGADASTFGLKITHNAISGQGTVNVVCRSGGGDTSVCSLTSDSLKISLKA
ncbi:uncharacterized protein GGS22DRAFT_155216 [Annulohypoxylon maeteangense]|uniref:uncharacterized protein n=1 Tax=Annulohypoxylon maeteangense TaxID=1927788 RepID=UPI0020074044|nr:uncharacterized protein GGS22DRAFT_155216 [Annulohypoxylon maeteangense]KAI0888158.1 hypothetical protein GGS22DRAFT_155216 [Annulohypoxylon maeteangense]